MSNGSGYDFQINYPSPLFLGLQFYGLGLFGFAKAPKESR